ncbi:MAG: hypothetical protein QOK40_2781 [Miltoncostaeaceae bacterium]|jgi:hypothetical protein|nr:hypothetical protein [Miltoncostaeaceae bacterium]
MRVCIAVKLAVAEHVEIDPRREVCAGVSELRGHHRERDAAGKRERSTRVAQPMEMCAVAAGGVDHPSLAADAADQMR